MREIVGYNANPNIRWGEAVSQNVHREGIFKTFILIHRTKDYKAGEMSWHNFQERGKQLGVVRIKMVSDILKFCNYLSKGENSKGPRTQP